MTFSVPLPPQTCGYTITDLIDEQMRPFQMFRVSHIQLTRTFISRYPQVVQSFETFTTRAISAEELEEAAVLGWIMEILQVSRVSQSQSLDIFIITQKERAFISTRNYTSIWKRYRSVSPTEYVPDHGRYDGQERYPSRFPLLVSRWRGTFMSLWIIITIEADSFLM